MQAFRGVTVLGATASLERTLHHLLHTVLALERAPHDVQLRVHVVPLARMRQLNCDYKGVDAPTDVLTFTPAGAADSFVNELLFGENNDMADAHEGEKTASVSSACCTNGSCLIAAPPHSATSSLSSSPSPAMRAELVELGDIFVSLEYMQRRCAASRSLPFVPYLHAAVVHATLHALGYDHTTSGELQRMVRREQQLGSRIAALSRRVPGYLPPLDVWDVEEVEKPAKLF